MAAKEASPLLLHDVAFIELKYSGVKVDIDVRVVELSKLLLVVCELGINLSYCRMFTFRNSRERLTRGIMQRLLWKQVFKNQLLLRLWLPDLHMGILKCSAMYFCTRLE